MVQRANPSLAAGSRRTARRRAARGPHGDRSRTAVVGIRPRVPGAHGTATVIWHFDYDYDHAPRRENVSHRSNARARLGDAARARSGDHRRRTYWITSSV